MTESSTLRSELVDTAIELGLRGLNRGSSGNVSARWRDTVLVTPSGVPFRELDPSQVVSIDAQGSWTGDLQPSSEWRFHCAILDSRPEIQAVVHTHSDFATSLACLGREIPAFHYMVAAAGGNSIRCAPYATFGSQRLAELVVEALDGRKACLLAHHGMIAIGESLSAALALAEEVEGLARLYCQVLQMGEARTLPDDEMAEVLRKFETYGVPSPRG